MSRRKIKEIHTAYKLRQGSFFCQLGKCRIGTLFLCVVCRGNTSEQDYLRVYLMEDYVYLSRVRSSENSLEVV